MRLTKGWFGWLIVIIGVLWALSIIGVVHASVGNLIATWWPAVLALWGLLAIIDRGYHHDEGFFLPVAALVAGLLLLAANLQLWTISSGRIWLLILALAVIAIGLEAALGSKWWRRGRTFQVRVGGPERRDPGRTYSPLDREIHLPLGEVGMDVRPGDLPDGDTALDVSVQLGSVDIDVDAKVGLLVHGQVGVGELKIGGMVAEGAQRALDYRSENFDAAPKRLTLRVSAGVGSITVRHEA